MLTKYLTDLTDLTSVVPNYDNLEGCTISQLNKDQGRGVHLIPANFAQTKNEANFVVEKFAFHDLKEQRKFVLLAK